MGATSASATVSSAMALELAEAQADMADFGDSPVGRRANELNHGRMIYSRGAVPLIRADGTHAGAVGVSGALPEQDEEIAAAGAAVLREREGT
jgi:uncharacterized protein GlcG (DUF336 family)